MKLYILSFVFLAVSGRTRTDRYDPINDETAGSFTYNIKKNNLLNLVKIAILTYKVLDKKKHEN